MARSAKGEHTDTTSRSQSHRHTTRRGRFAAQCNAAEVVGRGSQVTVPDRRRAAKHSSRQAFPCARGRSKSKRHGGIAQCVGAGATGESGGMHGSSASPRRRAHAHARAPARTIQPEMEGSKGRERAAHARAEGKKRGQQREGREADEAHAKSRPPRRHEPLGGQAEDESKKGLTQLSLPFRCCAWHPSAAAPRAGCAGKCSEKRTPQGRCSEKPTRQACAPVPRPTATLSGNARGSCRRTACASRRGDARRGISGKTEVGGRPPKRNRAGLPCRERPPEAPLECAAWHDHFGRLRAAQRLRHIRQRLHAERNRPPVIL